MGADERLRVGLVGAAGRGGSFRAALEANGARVLAVCDVNEEALDECARRMGAGERYADFEQMLDSSDLDAVVIGTPMQFHVPQSVAALERGLHVLCEVPAGVSVEECRDLVRASSASDAVYMMAENYTYIRPNVLVRELCRKGLFGTPFYAEGEYLHELKELNEVTRWRRHWQTGVRGITYGTHSLGPILQWLEGDRMVRVCCGDSGSHHADPRGDPYACDTAVMLCKTARGALIKIRLDMISDRPHAMHCHQLQGTDGCYESSRGGPVDADRIWLRALSEEPRWFGLDAVEEHMPAIWRDPPPEALRAGHGGGDYFEVLDFVRAIRGEAPCPIGVHEAMDMTLPGLVSQRSVQEGGRWLDVPDSREWTEGRVQPQLQMVWPEDRLGSPPEVHLPEGYGLRGYRPDDAQQWLALMHAAGFAHWTAEGAGRTWRSVIPDGLFVVEHRASGKIVASAMATHNPSELHPRGAELGWVAADPEHRGKGLGLVVCAAAVRRMLSAGYARIFLLTDDFRLPAIKTYLKLGFRPLLFTERMEERWRAVCAELGWPLEPAG
jgi:predicted dehydrogenase/GNAT superfamily N-acetyltransferase